MQPFIALTRVFVASFALMVFVDHSHRVFGDEKSNTNGLSPITLHGGGHTVMAGPVYPDVFPFSDDFEIDSTDRWNVVVGYLSQGEGDPVVDDYTVEFNFDYGSSTYNRFAPNGADFETLYIPPAPHSQGTTHGLKVTVNKNDDIEQCFAVNLYPKSPIFKGDYVLKFDMFMNHGSYGSTGSGTTESAIFGLNCTGTNANGQIFSGAAYLNAGLPRASDGLWFSITGDGGAGADLRAAVGTRNGPAVNLANAEGGFFDRDGDGRFDVGDEDAYLQQVFASPPAETPGVVGKRWVEVEIMQRDDIITWKLDNRLIASRPNTSGYKSGLPMIGYMDIFSSIADERDQTFVIFDNIRILPIRMIIVDTVENASGPTDGKTSLKEALTATRENDWITFNLPGSGPFYILTPEMGYPLITNHGLRIDGYSQIGSEANTNGILDGNSANIQIVLDSRSLSGGRTLVGEATGATGFGLSESAILGVKNAKGVDISGLAFLSRMTAGTQSDPDIYAIALMNESANARIHGCWFGVDPQKNAEGKWVVAGGRSAVASFRDTTLPQINYYQGYSLGLTIGTDGDSLNDLAELNVMVGNELAIHLQTPNTKVAGNFINIFPDGTFFNGASDLSYAVGKSIEAIENGQADEMLIGTDGNTISDGTERNIFGPVRYDVFAEFWRSATNVVIAGNYVGISIDRSSSFSSQASLIGVRKNSNVRVGSNFNGSVGTLTSASDLLEANLIYNLKQPLLNLHASNYEGDGSGAARIALRGNELVNNDNIFPFIAGSLDKISKFFFNPLARPDFVYRPSLSSSTTVDSLVGTVPDQNFASSSVVVVDVYLADLVSASKLGAEPQGKKYLASFVENSDMDMDPNSGSFNVDITALALTPDEVKSLTITANYVPDSLFGFNLHPWTTSFSSLAAADDLRIKSVSWVKGNVIITRTFGRGPFRLEKRVSVGTTSVWQPVDAIVEGNTFTYKPSDTAGFFRVKSGF